MEHGARPPLLSLITVVSRPEDLTALRDTWVSLRDQVHGDGEWLLATSGSLRASVEHLLAGEGPPPEHRVRVLGPTPADAEDPLARALGQAQGDLVAVLHPGDRLAPRAIAAVARAVDHSPEVDVVYGDHAVVSEGRRVVVRKPDWSPERLRHGHYLGRFAALRRSRLDQPAAGAAAGGLTEHGLALQVGEGARAVLHLPEVLLQVPGHDPTTDASPRVDDTTWDAGVGAVQAHLHRVDILGSVARGRAPGLLSVQRSHDHVGSVSVVLNASGRRHLAWGQRRTMVTEAVRTAVGTHEVEFVVVHDDGLPGTVLQELSRIPGARVRAVRLDEPTSPTGVRNLGALHADGSCLVFLDEDTEATSAETIRQLVAPLREGAVGATGPKIVGQDLRVQSAGVTYGDGTVSDLYLGSPHPLAHGAGGELWINREVTALAPPCLALRREVFERVGGFSETLAPGAAAVDLAFKLDREGLRRLWLCDTLLYRMSTGAPTSVDRAGRRALARRWGHVRTTRDRHTLVVDEPASPATERAVDRAQHA